MSVVIKITQEIEPKWCAWRLRSTVWVLGQQLKYLWEAWRAFLQQWNAATSTNTNMINVFNAEVIRDQALKGHQAFEGTSGQGTSSQVFSTCPSTRGPGISDVTCEGTLIGFQFLDISNRCRVPDRAFNYSRRIRVYCELYSYNE